MDTKLTIDEELIIFKNINSYNKKFSSQHTNFIVSNNVKDVNKNQIIAKNKLREFVKKEDVDFEFWKTL